ncbi:MAG: DUF308 domain-containing protein [Clostridia bacterium]|nr:DUF308 domain-containing protein [Clostridia bacterium]
MYSFSRTRRVSILMAVLSIVLGVVFIIFPGLTGSVFCWALAIIALLVAAGRYWAFFQAHKNGETAIGPMCTAIILTLFGVFCITRPDVILSFLPLVLGILLLIDGIGKLPIAVSAFTSGIGSRVFAGIAALIPLILGIVLILNPFGAAKAVIMFFGVSIALDGALDLLSLISMIRREKEDYKDIR